MRICSIDNKNQSFGTKVIISSEGAAALRKFESQNRCQNRYSVNKHIKKLENNGKNETLLIGGNRDGSVLRIILMDFVTKKYVDLSYSLEKFCSESKVSLWKSYKTLSSIMAANDK